jgi:NADH dehydrogenase
MNLVVGATGMVGGEVCRLLVGQGEPVRAMVRDTSSPEAVARLRALGADIVRGDVKDRASTDAACRGVTAVVSTASASRLPQEGDSLATVDERGQIDLIDAAAAAGVRRFVMISFPEVDLEFPLQSAKRAAEEHLRKSGITYTILRPTAFTEVWLSPMLGFDLAGGTCRIYGSGQEKTTWISFLDVAACAVAALDSPGARNEVIHLGGPDALSPLEVVRMAEEITGKRLAVEHVAEQALQAQFASATDPLQKSFAALMLFAAGGSVIDPADAIRTLPIRPMRSVRDHVRAAAAADAASPAGPA